MSAAVWLASSMFMRSDSLRMISALVLPVFPFLETVNALYRRSRKHLRTQLIVLLQVLTTSVSSGYSVERSLTLIRPVMENTFGRKCILIEPLLELKNSIKVHSDLKASLDRFARSIDFPETIPVFHALAISSQIGSSSLSILRSSCQMLSDMNSVQNEIRSSNAGKNAEAAILCVMPFAITYLLGGMADGYLDTALDTHTGSVVLLIAFALAVASCSLLLRFISGSDRDYKEKDEAIKHSKARSSEHLTSAVIANLPRDLIASRHELFSELYLDVKPAYRKFVQKQILTFLIFTILSAFILFMLKKNVFISIGIGAASLLLGSYDLRKKADLKKESLMQDIPLFFCLTSTLLQAGLQLPKTIEICQEAFDTESALSSEIRNLRALILSGISPGDAVERFSLRIQIPEAQAALLLIARYARLGTSEVLNMLSLQASSCWNLCRNAARKREERQSLGLLFPMTLDFICVLLVAITPAIISMGI